MGKALLQKVRITGLKKHYKILMQELHKQGVLEIVENEEFIKHSVEKVDQYFEVSDLARIDFSLQFLTPFEAPKPKLDALFSGGKLLIAEEEAKERLKKFAPLAENIISECEKIQYEIGQIEQEQDKLLQRIERLMPFRNLRLPIQTNYTTETAQTYIAKIGKNEKDAFVQNLAKASRLIDIQFFGTTKNDEYFRLSFHRDSQEKVDTTLRQFEIEPFEFEADFEAYVGTTPREAIRQIEKRQQELTHRTQKAQKRQQELAIHTDDLRILYDYNAWRKKKHDLQHKILKTDTIFAFEAWMPLSHYNDLERWIVNSFVNDVSLEKIHPKKDETEPVLFDNKTVSSSFEPVTEMFGFPTKKDLDPTPFLAPFFFVFFGLCLSDVGYGLTLFTTSLIFLLCAKMGAEAKKGLRLLTLCGASATGGGIILGSYFGMTPEQIPGFLSFLLNPAYAAGEAGVNPFRGQLIDTMSGTGPITLLKLTIALGFIQLLFGLLLDTYKNIKNKDYVTAFCDPFSWFLFLIAIAGFGVADMVSFLDKELFKTLMIAFAGLLVLTQGRTQKIWLLKPLSGALGLFGITGYLSDLLSYSRIMALGLATGVIAFAMNLTAEILYGMMPHWSLGLVVAIGILLFGHALNFALSLLGAFVHSGRLQFIEFFSKFFDGNGRKFEPFQRQKKYLFFK